MSFAAVCALAILLGLPAEQDAEAGWAAYYDAVPAHEYPDRGPIKRQPKPDHAQQRDALLAALEVARGTPAEPHVLYNLASTLFFLGDFAAALERFEEVRARFSDHGLVTVADGFEDDGLSLVDRGIRDCRDEIAVRKVYEVKEVPEAVLDESAEAIVHTTLGDFTLRFYRSASPKTVANFQRLANEGFYADTYFHRAIGLRHVIGGDPNTRKSADVDRTDDGRGSPGYDLEPEYNTARHGPGAVSMLATSDGRAHGSQFLIAVSDQPQFNGTQAVFAQVVEGLEVVKAISQQSGDESGNPYEPVWITGIEWQKAGK